MMSSAQLAGNKFVAVCQISCTARHVVVLQVARREGRDDRNDSCHSVLSLLLQPAARVCGVLVFLLLSLCLTGASLSVVEVLCSILAVVSSRIGTHVTTFNLHDA
jgi:hypothetical protein